MALGLEDLNSIQVKNKEQSIHDKERVLRPWEGYEKLGSQTRTITAREAVKKAREIVHKNDIMAEEFRRDNVSKKVIRKLEDEKNMKEQQFLLLEEIIPIIQKVKSRNSIIGFFKNFL